METFLLAMRARILLAVGLAYLVIGLYLGTDPLALAWRAPAAALAAMAAGGWMLGQVAQVVQDRLAADMAERQLAAEQAAAKAAAAVPAPAPAAGGAAPRPGRAG